MFSTYISRWSQQKNAGSGVSFAFSQRVLQKGVKDRRLGCKMWGKGEPSEYLSTDAPFTGKRTKTYCWSLGERASEQAKVLKK